MEAATFPVEPSTWLSAWPMVGTQPRLVTQLAGLRMFRLWVCRRSGQALSELWGGPESHLSCSQRSPFLCSMNCLIWRTCCNYRPTIQRGFLARAWLCPTRCCTLSFVGLAPGPPKILSPETIAGTWPPNMSYIFAYATPGTHAPGDHLADLFCA